MSTKDFNGIYDGLKRLYPSAKPMLEFSNVFELLIAVMLSAQCTDKRVNIVTGELFKTYKTPSDFASLSVGELEPLIRPCGLSNSKAKHIVSACKKIVSDFGGQVPSTKEELTSLDGVGGKTANVVLSVGFGVPAIAVDTHVFRVSNRLGLASSKDVGNTEKQLMKAIPKDKWSECHHLLIYHGRSVCKAQKPLCGDCSINEFCKFYKGRKV